MATGAAHTPATPAAAATSTSHPRQHRRGEPPPGGRGPGHPASSTPAIGHPRLRAQPPPSPNSALVIYPTAYQPADGQRRPWWSARTSSRPSPAMGAMGTPVHRLCHDQGARLPHRSRSLPPRLGMPTHGAPFMTVTIDGLDGFQLDGKRLHLPSVDEAPPGDLSHAHRQFFQGPLPTMLLAPDTIQRPHEPLPCRSLQGGGGGLAGEMGGAAIPTAGASSLQRERRVNS